MTGLETYPQNSHLTTRCRVGYLRDALVLDGRGRSRLDFDRRVTAGGDAFKTREPVPMRVEAITAARHAGDGEG